MQFSPVHMESTALRCIGYDLTMLVPLQCYTPPSDAPAIISFPLLVMHRTILLLGPNYPFLPLAEFPLILHALKCFIPAVTKLVSFVNFIERILSLSPFIVSSNPLAFKS